MPKCPIYPRPVSPLRYEQVVAKPVDTYWDDSRSDQDNEERAAKRRRIEQLGEQYLRGDGLFILTAGLKGPFGGWQNPWRRSDRNARDARSSRKTISDAREIPETKARYTEEARTRRKAVAKRQDYERAVAAAARTTSSRGHLEEVVRTPRSMRNSAERTLKHGRTAWTADVELSMESHKKPWLKRDKNCEDFDESQRHGSPTPVALVPAGKTIEPTTIAGLQSKDDTTSQMRFTNDQSKLQQLSPVNSRRPSTVSIFDKVNDAETELVEDIAPSASLPSPVSDDNLRRDLQGEGQPSKSSTKRLTTITIPPSTNFSPFEYRTVGPLALSKNLYGSKSQAQTTRRSRRSHKTSSVNAQVEKAIKSRSALPMTSEQLTDFITSRNSQDHQATAALQPVLSTETSNATTNLMPSAQQVPSPTMARIPDQVVASNAMLDEPPILEEQTADTSTLLTTPAAIALAQAQLAQDLMTPAIPKQKVDQHQVGDMTETLTHHDVSDDTKPPLDTQELLDTQSPWPITTAKKRPTAPTPMKSTEGGRVSKSRSKRSSKIHNSVLSDDSQSSIKSVLKISKSATATATSKPSELNPHDDNDTFGNHSTDMNTSQNDSLRRARSQPTPFEPATNSNSAPPASNTKPGANSTLTSTANPQDAQKIRPTPSAIFTFEANNSSQNLVHDHSHDDFNLEDAMDDISSFLGTWDAEKEASSLSASGVKSLNSQAGRSSLRSSMKKW